MTMLKYFIKFGVLTALVAMTCSSAKAFTTNVTVEDFDFSPPNVSIGVNDSVKWTSTGFNTHTATSTGAATGLWDSGPLGNGGTFTHTFTAGGSFPYLCSFHPFMTGSVDVSSPNSPPTGTITNPVSGVVFAAPWTGTVQANPADTDGTINRVEFLTNSVSAGIVSNTPYNLALSNLPAGTYVLKAVATDNASAIGTSP